MTPLVPTSAARADRREITAYTIERFGLLQARRVRAVFEEALRRIVESPHLRRENPELDPPGRSFRYLVVLRVFLVVYEANDEGIRVVRLLHGARNLAEELERGDFA